MIDSLCSTVFLFTHLLNQGRTLTSTLLAFGKLRSIIPSEIYLSHRDTVSSVGLFPQTHPYSSLNYNVKCFRHALALDEWRTRFRPHLWVEEDLLHELDVDVPIEWKIDQIKPDGWQYTPPDNRFDVKEVWFEGDLTYK
jgi:uncharacterized protein (DUF2235 family)